VKRILLRSIDAKFGEKKKKLSPGDTEEGDPIYVWESNFLNAASCES
jgi:hypothetical protein